MSTIAQRLDKLAEQFSEATNQRERLQLIIEQSAELQQTPRESFGSEDKVPGCVSDVYVKARKEGERIRFLAFTESLVTKGYLAILVEALDGANAQEILSSSPQIKKFIKDAGLDVSLVPSRTNAFARIHEAMLRQTMMLME